MNKKIKKVWSWSLNYAAILEISGSVSTGTFGQEEIITCWIGKEIKNEGYKIYPYGRGWGELSLTVSICIRRPGAYLNNLQEERGGGAPLLLRISISNIYYYTLDLGMIRRS